MNPTHCVMPLPMCAALWLCVALLLEFSCGSSLLRGMDKSSVQESGAPSCNSTSSNSTGCSATTTYENPLNFWERITSFLSTNKHFIFRALIVFGSVTAIIVIYISCRCIRRHRQISKSRKYGLITMPDDKLELKPLDDDDDEEEDMTVFDRTKPKSTRPSGGIRPYKSQRLNQNGKHSR